MNLKMERSRQIEWALIIGAILLPLLFFASLDWSPAKTSEREMSHYFGADNWRVLETLKDSDTVSHYRSVVHPYFSLFAVTFSKMAAAIVGTGLEFDAYRVIFGTLGVFLFWLYLYRETNTFTAWAAVSLLLSTMTVRVWSTVPETFLFGFCTLMIGLNAARVGANPVVVMVVTIAGTVTNVFFGLVYACKKLKISPALIKSIFILGLVCAILSLLQKTVYPTATHFYDFIHLRGEGGYVVKSISDIPFRIFDFFYTGFVLPIQASQTLPVMPKPVWQVFFAGQAVGVRYNVAVYAVLAMVSALIVASVWTYLRSERDICGSLIFSFLCFQLLLHSIYGDTPFLYSYHFTPFIVLFIARYPLGALKAIWPYVLIALAALVQDVNLSNYSFFKNLFL